MRASVFCGTSLDGYIARLDGSFDFLLGDGGDTGEPSEPGPHGFEEFLASVDCLVMGRKTYDTVLPFDTWPYGAKPIYVLSTRPLAPAPAGAVVERLSGEPAAIAAELERRGVGHAYVDGGDVIQQFLRAGLIDRIIVTTVPVLIGSGIALFGPVARDVRLRHVRTQTYPGGLVQSEYEVRRR